MNILMVGNGAYPDETGGAHVYIYELSRHMARLGHQVTALIRKSSPRLPTQEMIEGVRYVRYPYAESSDPIRWRLRLYQGARKAFTRLASQQSFDVVHGHWPHPAAAVFGSAALGSSLRVYTFHAPFFEEEQVEADVLRRVSPLNPRQIIKNAWVPLSLWEKRVTERRVLQRSSLVFTLSEFMRSRVQDHFGVPGSSVRVIPGGADIARFSPVDDDRRLAIRADLGIDPQAIMLLTVRRLVPRMGLANLIHAIRIAASHEPRLRLCIGGAGPLQPELENLIDQLGLRGKVRMLGFVPEIALPDWYRAADLFVLPSEFLEGFGLATVEAMACGTPALGTPIGATPEILRGLDERLILGGTSPEHIADGILRNVRRDDLPLLRRTAGEYARQHYSWQGVAAAVESELRQALAAHSSRGRSQACG